MELRSHPLPDRASCATGPQGGSTEAGPTLQDRAICATWAVGMEHEGHTTYGVNGTSAWGDSTVRHGAAAVAVWCARIRSRTAPLARPLTADGPKGRRRGGSAWLTRTRLPGVSVLGPRHLRDLLPELETRAWDQYHRL